MTLRRDWNEFWFSKKSPGPLGAFRVALGSIFVFWGLLVAPPNLYTWFSEGGAVPLSFYHMTKSVSPEISLLDNVTDPHILFLYWLALLLFAVLFTVGFCTRLSGFFLFLVFDSFCNRDLAIMNSGDTMLRCALFLSLLAPSGASCSVDRLIAIWRGKDAGGDPQPVELWAQRLMQLQVALVYSATFCSKISGHDWLNGTAVYFPLHMVELTRFPLPSFFSDPRIINLLTWGTLVVEGSMATLVWSRKTRPYVLVAGVCLHSGIEYALNIPLFSLIMITTYLNFVYNEWLASWVHALSKSFERYQLTVLLPNGVEQTGRWWKVIERMDIFRLCVPYESGEHQLVVNGRGWQSQGASALRRVLLCLPALWLLSPLMLVPGSLRVVRMLLPQPSRELTGGNPISTAAS